jgi:hypothetical protein
MSFEDVECLKDAFTVYDISGKPPHSASQTLVVLRKSNISYMRAIITPPVYGVKHHIRMLIYSLLYKLRIKRSFNN